MQLLSHIPWETNQTAIQSKSKEESCLYAPHIRWICAKFAVRCFFADNQTDKFFKLLCEAQHWSYENGKKEMLFFFFRKDHHCIHTVIMKFSGRCGDIRAYVTGRNRRFTISE